MTNSESPRSLTPPERLTRALAAAASGLPNLFDESTDYFHPFWLAFATPIESLTPEAFRVAAHVDSHYQIDFRDAEDLFSSAKEAGDSSVEAGYALLRTLMHATLSGLTIAFARRQGAVRVRMWLFGRFDSSTLVGLKSEVTET